jgi:small neutral amino acid transporter SnatA (MarC family)
MAETNRYADRAVLYVLLALIAAVWFGVGGLVFLGILQDTHL